MSKNVELCFALVLVMVATAQPAASQPPREDRSVVVTTGEGVVKRAPDRAWVSVAAESRAKTPQEAQQQNARAITAVMEKLKAAGLPADAIQTTAIDLQPEYDYTDNRQRLRGYVARNSVEVRVDTLDKLGDIIDSVVSAGATSISGVRFDLQKREAAEREALQLAVRDARERARAAAEAAQTQIDRIVRIEEHRLPQNPPPRPMMAMRAEMAQAPSTPVAPGEIEIRTSVTLTVAIK